MLELDRVLGLAQKLGAEYADARFVAVTETPVRATSEGVQLTKVSRSQGLGVRVLVDGAWGFSATAHLDTRSLEKVADEAVKIASVSAKHKIGDGVSLPPLSPLRARWQTPHKIDPLDVSPQETGELLSDAVAAAGRVPGICHVEGTLLCRKEDKEFASTDGREIRQKILLCGASVTALAENCGVVQRRSFSSYASGGFEFLQGLDLKKQAEKAAAEATLLAKAPPCPQTTTDLVAGGASVADKLGRLCDRWDQVSRGGEGKNRRVGSPVVSLQVDPLAKGGLGGYGFDDEGVEGQPINLVETGSVEDFLTSRELASRDERHPNGSMRAEGWFNAPVTAASNVSLVPGDWTLEEMVRDTDEGIFVDTPKGYGGVHFDPEIAYEIKDGSLGQVLRNPLYSCGIQELWSSCDAVADKDAWGMYGFPRCPQGEPPQTFPKGFGASPARFRAVKVGARR